VPRRALSGFAVVITDFSSDRLQTPRANRRPEAPTFTVGEVPAVRPMGCMKRSGWRGLSAGHPPAGYLTKVAARAWQRDLIDARSEAPNASVLTPPPDSRNASANARRRVQACGLVGLHHARSFWLITLAPGSRTGRAVPGLLARSTAVRAGEYGRASARRG